MPIDHFAKQKKDILSKADFSKKGSIDERLIPIIKHINFLDDYYTTSSCSGRIIIMSFSESGKKNQAKWIYVTHDLAKFEDMKLNDLPKDPVYFRQEVLILHIACRNLEFADKLLHLVANAGFRRTAIIAMGKDRVIVEVMSSEQLSVPIALNGKFIVDEEYLCTLVNIANQKMEKNFKLIKKLESKIKELK